MCTTTGFIWVWGSKFESLIVHSEGSTHWATSLLFQFLFWRQVSLKLKAISLPQCSATIPSCEEPFFLPEGLLGVHYNEEWLFYLSPFFRLGNWGVGWGWGCHWRSKRWGNYISGPCQPYLSSILRQVKKKKKKVCVGWRDGSVVKCWLLFQRSWVQFPAITWWLTAICNEIWCPSSSDVFEDSYSVLTHIKWIILKKSVCMKQGYENMCYIQCGYIRKRAAFSMITWENMYCVQCGYI